MDKRWSLQKLLLQLGAPYAKNETYKKFEGAILREEANIKNGRYAEVGRTPRFAYIPKYKNAPLIRNQIPDSPPVTETKEKKKTFPSRLIRK